MKKADVLLIGGVHYAEEGGAIVSLRTYDNTNHGAPATASDQFLFWMTMAQLLLDRNDLYDWQRMVLQDTLADGEKAKFPRAYIENLH